MGEEKEILLRGKVCAYLTCRLMGDPFALPSQDRVSNAARLELGRGVPDDPAESALLVGDKPRRHAVRRRVGRRSVKFAHAEWGMLLLKIRR
jgi:hypothetical protein